MHNKLVTEASSSVAASPSFTPEAVDIKTAARIAGISRTTIYKAINGIEGLPHLASFKVAKRRLISVTTLRAWLSHIEGARP